MNNSGSKILIGCLAALLIVGGIIALVIIVQYNGLVKQNESVNGKWAEVDNQLKRRYDLIPNLNKVADKFTKQEREIYDKITQARQAYGGAKTPQQQVAAANQMESALSRLLVIVENNPELKSDRVLVGLMDELAGTENRIAVARQRYNEEVQIFNTRIKVLPASLFASLLHFSEREYFKTPEKEKATPEVKFE